jgi:hypothetical protein
MTMVNKFHHTGRNHAGAELVVLDFPGYTDTHGWLLFVETLSAFLTRESVL